MNYREPEQWRQGWYKFENPNNAEDYFLTWDALKKELHQSSETLTKITATTHKGGVNQGKLRTAVRHYLYRIEGFIVYSLVDMQLLLSQNK